MADPEETTTTFSAAEAAVYDRQMRLWGVEAQQRLQRSHVLVAGLSALGSELAKNLALSGMAVTLQDASAVSAAAVGSQFFLDEADVGKNVRSANFFFSNFFLLPSFLMEEFFLRWPRRACRGSRSSTRSSRCRVRRARSKTCQTTFSDSSRLSVLSVLKKTPRWDFFQSRKLQFITTRY